MTQQLRVRCPESQVQSSCPSPPAPLLPVLTHSLLREQAKPHGLPESCAAGLCLQRRRLALISPGCSSRGGRDNTISPHIPALPLSGHLGSSRIPLLTLSTENKIGVRSENRQTLALDLSKT